MSSKRACVTPLCCFRAPGADRGLEGGEDPGDLPGGSAGVRRQPKAERQGRHDIREAPVGADRVADFRQPKFGDVLLAEAEKQEAAAVPGGNLGRRPEDIVEATYRQVDVCCCLESE